MSSVVSGGAAYLAAIVCTARSATSGKTDTVSAANSANGPMAYQVPRQYGHAWGSRVIAAPHSAPGFIRFGCRASMPL
jgi:hypothetical protein